MNWKLLLCCDLNYNGDLVVSSSVTHFGTHAFAVAGPKAWNQLQMHIRARESVDSFKTALKSHFHFVD